MKLRIQGNTLRLRLKISEIDLLKSESKVIDGIEFGTNKLVYSLELKKQDTITTHLSNNEIRVVIPFEMANTWMDSEDVSIENNHVIPNILIEKDFKCTSKVCIESEKDQSDFFHNPNE